MVISRTTQKKGLPQGWKTKKRREAKGKERVKKYCTYTQKKKKKEKKKKGKDKARNRKA